MICLKESLTSLSMAGPTVEHATYVHCSLRTSSRGTVDRVRLVDRRRKGSPWETHYISVMEHPIVKIDMVIKSEILANKLV